MKHLLVLPYLAAITAANLLTSHDPRWAVPNAFLLIGVDLVCRDALDDAWREHRAVKMAALIGAGSLISYLLGGDGKVAVASAVAFAAAFSTDWAVYARLRQRVWLERSMWSNIPAAAVDSLVFPLLAFPTLDWLIVASLFAAKVGGGAFWALVLRPMMEPEGA